MKIRISSIASTTLCLAMFAPPVSGQETCVPLLRHGLYNTHRTTSGSSNVNTAKSSFCSDYSSFKSTGQAGSLEASFKLFSGSASYSKQSAEAVAQAVCRSKHIGRDPRGAKTEICS